jgi:hypothetical protein
LPPDCVLTRMPYGATTCHQVKDSVAVHVPCSSKKMGIEAAFLSVASKCAHEVHPSGIPCCGMAGDRGMRYPELTSSSLQHLDLPASCSDGYSTSRTCEVRAAPLSPAALALCRAPRGPHALKLEHLFVRISMPAVCVCSPLSHRCHARFAPPAADEPVKQLGHQLPRAGVPG